MNYYYQIKKWIENLVTHFQSWNFKSWHGGGRDQFQFNAVQKLYENQILDQRKNILFSTVSTGQIW